jgi:hypothetical protein
MFFGRAPNEPNHALPRLRMDQIQNTSRKVLSKQEGTENVKKPSQSTIPLKDAVILMQWLTLRGALHYTVLYTTDIYIHYTGH